MTPEQKQQRLAEIAERASTATKGPWRVDYMETTHRLGSPACKETCEKGKPPVRIEHQSQQEAAQSGYPGITEMHVHRHVDIVDDIVADNGSHVFCAGHDYDEKGTVASNDAEFIAHAPEDIDFLLSLVKSQEAGDHDNKRYEKLVEEMSMNSEEVKAIAARAFHSPQFSVDTYMFDVRQLLRFHQTCCAELHDAIALVRTLDQRLRFEELAGKGAINYTIELEQKLDDAAASMRSACVEKVKAMRDEWEAKRNTSEPLSKLRNRYDAAFCAANEILTELETLSIEKPKE